MAIARYSLMIWLIALGTALFSRSDRLIIGWLLGAESLAVYATIMDAVATINTVSALPVQPLVPILSQHLAQQNLGSLQLRHQIQQALEINDIVALVCGVWLFTLAPIVVNILLVGATSPAAILAFRIATFACALFSLNAVGFCILMNLDVGLVTSIQLFASVILLGLITIGARSCDLLGAASGNMEFLITLSMVFFGLRKLNFPPQIWRKSLTFPLMWFGISIALALLLYHQAWALVGYAAWQTLVLLIWFLITHAQSRSQIMAKLGFAP